MTTGASFAGRVVPLPRRPGTPARILLLACSLAGFIVVLALAFPPGAPDRLPVLALALALALLTASRSDRGIVALSVLFPCAGFLARVFGGNDPMAWPVLLFAAAAAGWTFRFLYDFESLPSPSRLDPHLKALLAIWAFATLIAVVRARTLWAFLHGLSERAVNSSGLSDAAAIRESVLAFGALAGGAVFFFLLRRSREALRQTALLAAVLGVCVSALAAVFQRAGLLPGEPRPFWKLTGRLSGGAADPNSLGLLCALALLVTAAAGMRHGARRAAALLGTLLLAAGLVLSGSRSGFLIPIFGLAALFAFRSLSARSRALRGQALGLAAAAVALAVLAVAVFGIGGGSRGSLTTRLGETFDSALPIEYRISARPILWRSALSLFLDHPAAGAGLGSFSWRLPDLLREQGRQLPMRDNPGSAYLQALAESGIIGFAVTLVFALSLGRQAARTVASDASGPERVGAGVAVIAFLLALAIGSHWLAPDVSLFFFLLAATAAVPKDSAQPDAPGQRRLLAAAVLVYAVAAVAAIAATARPGEAFRHSRLLGFYGVEQGPGGPFRWTGRNFAIRLLPGETMRLTLAHYTPEGKPVTLESHVEGRVALRRTLRPGEATTLDLRAPSSEPRVILFSLSGAFVPRRLGVSEDPRELGLMALTP